MCEINTGLKKHRLLFEEAKSREDGLFERIKELEDENARLRQQRDAANAQLDFLMENLKTRQAD